MLRHSVLFTLRDDVTEQGLLMMKGLAYLRFECPTVLALDFGMDVFGGSAPFRGKSIDQQGNGGDVAYDAALHLDFADEAGLKAYGANPVHREVSGYNASICRGELTARVDWHPEQDTTHWYGHLRHSVMFVWNPQIDAAQKEVAFSQWERLKKEPETDAVVVGTNVGKSATNYDWMVDILVPDLDSADHLITSEPYVAAMSAVAPLTQHGKTARHTHVIHGL